MLTVPTTLSSFKLEFIIGRPYFGRTPVEDKAGFFTISPIIPINFVNTGARGGTVKDINIVVTTETNKWRYFPLYFCSEYGGKALKEGPREVFSPIFIPGKEEVNKIVLFNPIREEDSLIPPIFSDNEGFIPVGEYNFQFFVSYGSSSELKSVKSLNYKFEKELVSRFQKKHIPVILYELELPKARDKLKNKILKRIK